MQTQTIQISVLDAAIEATKGICPASVFGEPMTANEPYVQSQISVLIGVLGDVRGNLVIGGELAVFSTIAEQMSGMALEGEMLESFVGELGNMIAGNMATKVSSEGLFMDITPPTVIVGDARLGGFQRLVSATAEVGDSGSLRINLLVNDEQ